ncbi:MAG: hypothetical protein ABIJ40_00265 [Bacteroidota bacterium]|nr:hypothetical protein [bacterium]MBU1873517.1 hypothetical protein [bacterium]
MSKTFTYFILFLMLLFSYCSDLFSPDKDDNIPVVNLIENSSEFDSLEIRIDAFSIDTAYVKGKTIYLDILYTGGCKEHDFNLYITGPIIKTNPPGCDIYLSHDSRMDSCTKEISTILKYDLSPLDKYDEDKLILFIHTYDSEILQSIFYEK